MPTLKEQFEQDGYLIIPDLYTAAECDVLIQRAAQIAKDFEFNGKASIFQTSEQARTSDDYFLNSGDNISCFFEKDAFDANGQLRQPIERSLNKIGHAMHDLDADFAAFSRAPQLVQLAAELGLDHYFLIQSMFIFKHAKIGGVVDVHQDATFLYTEPLSVVGFWFALEDATIDNGCLWAKPGGHKTSLRERFQRNGNGGTEMLKLDDTPIDMDGMLPLEVKKGTCIVLHGLLPHYSLPNTSGKSRQAYAVHTIDPTVAYPAGNWLQRPSIPLYNFSGAESVVMV